MQALELTISDMHCGKCVERVTRALEQLEGVQPQEVAIGSATLKYDPKRTEPERIAAAVRNAGFPTDQK